MNTPIPIKDKNKLREIEHYLKHTNIRDYIMFEIGLYTGLRISDILRLRVFDVKNKDHIYIRAKKTGKEIRLAINDELKKVLDGYVKDMYYDDYLIQSRQSFNKPITTTRAYQIIREAGEKCRVYGLSTHSLRKTFGFHYYKNTKDAKTLQLILGHTSEHVTLRYIGIQQLDIDRAIKAFRY